MHHAEDVSRRTVLRNVLRFAGWTAFGGPLALATSRADAQAWPSKPIRLIAASAPGGPTDVIARTLAERFTRTLGTPVIVENRTGGTGTIALDAAAKAPPDGHTLAIGFTGSNVMVPLLNPKLPFNALTDLTPIGQIAMTGNMLVVHPSVPATNLAEFLVWVKSKSSAGPVPYGSWGNGSGGHLAGEYLRMLTGADLYHVPYRTTSALTVDLVGGHVLTAFLDMSNTLAQVRAGKLRAIANTGTQRATVLPEVATMREQGVNFGAGIWYGLFGPAGMPPAVVARLSAELAEAMQLPEYADRWLSVFGTRPVTSPHDEFNRTVRRDWETWKAVIAAGKISLD